MLETFQTILRDTSRSLFKKLRASPVLYLFFSSMMVFSVIMFAFLTLFLMKAEAEISILDLFYTVFFLFLMKSAADMHTYFIKSPSAAYALSTQVNQSRTVFEIFLAVFVIQVGIWFSLSALYLISLSLILHVPVWYPLEYMLFSIGVISAIFLGCTLSLHFFSPQKYRLAPTAILLGFFWFSQNFFFVVFTLPLVVLHLYWGLTHAMSSYRFVSRRKHEREAASISMKGVAHALFYREVTTLWRDRLLTSFIVTSISSA